MIKSIDAMFDGKVFRPNEPLELQPNTRVRLTIETTATAGQKTQSFLRTASLLDLDGPPDWSEHIEDYLYGDSNDGRKPHLP